MNKLLSGCVLVALLLVGGATYLNYEATQKLRREVAALQASTEQTARLQNAPRTVPMAGAPVGSANNEAWHAELAQLRDDVRALSKTTQDIARIAQTTQTAQAQSAAKNAESAIPVKLIPASAWKNAGVATPSAALETVLWAAVGGEVDTLADAITFSGSAREKANAMFAMMSDATRAQYGTPEKLMALMISRDAAEVTGMQVIDQRGLSPDDTVLRVRFGNDQGKTKENNFPLHRTPTGWRAVLDDNSVEKVARQLLGPAANGGK